MKIMHRLTWRSIWLNKARTVVTLIGIALSAALFMSVTTAAYSLWHFIVRGYEYETGDFFVSFDYVTEEQYAAARADIGANRMADMKILGYTHQYDRASPSGTYAIAAMGENFLKQMPVPLMEGRLPENSREILIPDLYLSVCRYENWEAPQVGDTLTLSVVFSVWPDREPAVPSDVPQEAVEKEFTVVGIMASRNYRTAEEDPLFSSILTAADGLEGPTLWHRLFLKTSPFRAYAVSRRDYGTSALHTKLLAAYGFTGQENTTLMILLMAAALLLIVMAAAHRLISNAFFISVTDRTKQFGLLSGVGATRKQIRASVRFESFALMALGIPVGILVGYGAVAIVLRLYGSHLARLFTFSIHGGVTPQAEFSPAAILAALLVCAITAWLSARKPANRAAQITPLEAIRQNQVYQSRTEPVSVSRFTRKLFGIPGFIGAKYYQNTRQNYRTVVATLAFSMVLFVCSAYFCDQQNMLADAKGAEYFDFLATSIEPNWQKTYQTLRSGSAIERSAIICEDSFMRGFFRSADLHEEYKKIQEQHPGKDPDYSAEWSEEWFSLYFLEDELFAKHLKSEGIDPEPYLEEGRMLAVTVRKSYGGFLVTNEAGEWEKVQFYGYALPEYASPVRCLPLSYPRELVAPAPGKQDSSGVFQPMQTHTRYIRDGKIILQVGGKSFVEEITDELVDGENVIHYYSYDPSTGRASTEILFTATVFAPKVEIGAQLQQLPYGVSTQNSDGVLLLLPLSKLPISKDTPKLCLDTGDYQTTLAALEACAAGNLAFSFKDFNKLKMNERGIVTLVRAFSTGFTLLIGMIACANVINTITANITLRRRDYGMLRSMGFTQKDLYRMTAYECARYSVMAILWSALLSITLCYGIHRISRLGYITEFSPPWDMFVLGIGLVITVLFASAVYAISTIRKDSPIDAIRMDNI